MRVQAMVAGNPADQNRIGAYVDPIAVLDSRFRVRKTKGLQVWDAEKAVDMIVEHARH